MKSQSRYFAEEGSGFKTAPLQTGYRRADAGAGAAQAQVLLRVSRSVIVQRVVPGGNCNDAVPLDCAASTFASTRRSVVLCVSVKLLPTRFTVPVPVKVVPPQQKV